VMSGLKCVAVVVLVIVACTNSASTTTTIGAFLSEWGIVTGTPGSNNVFGCNETAGFATLDLEDVTSTYSPMEILRSTLADTDDNVILYSTDVRLWQAQYSQIVHRLRRYPNAPLYHWIEIVPSVYTNTMVVLRSHVCDHVISLQTSELTQTTNQANGYKSQLYRRCGPDTTDLVFNMTCAEANEYAPTNVMCICNDSSIHRASTLSPVGCIEGCAETHEGCTSAYYSYDTDVSTTAAPTASPVTTTTAPTFGPTAVPTYPGLPATFSCVQALNTITGCSAVADYRKIVRCYLNYTRPNGTHTVSSYSLDVYAAQTTAVICDCDQFAIYLTSMVPAGNTYTCEGGGYVVQPTSAPTPVGHVAGPVSVDCNTIDASTSVIVNTTTVVLGTGRCTAIPVSENATSNWCNMGTYWTATNYTIEQAGGPTVGPWVPHADSTIDDLVIDAMLPFLRAAFVIPAGEFPPPPCICSANRQPFWSRNSDLVRVEQRAAPASTTSAPSWWPTTKTPTASVAPTAPTATPTSPTPAPTYADFSSIPFPVYPSQCLGSFGYCVSTNTYYCTASETKYPGCSHAIPCPEGALLLTDAGLSQGGVATGVPYEYANIAGCGPGHSVPYNSLDYGIRGLDQCDKIWGLCIDKTDGKPLIEYCVSSTVQSCTKYQPCDEDDAAVNRTYIGTFFASTGVGACQTFVAPTHSPAYTVAPTAPTPAPTTLAPTSVPTTAAPTLFYGPWDNANVVMIRNFWGLLESVDYMWQYTLNGPIFMAVQFADDSGVDYIEYNHGLDPSTTDVLSPSRETCTATPGCTPLVNPVKINVLNTSDSVYQCLWVIVQFYNPPNSDASGPVNIQVWTEFTAPHVRGGKHALGNMPFFAYLNSAFMSRFLGAPAWEKIVIQLDNTTGGVNATVNTVVDAAYWTPWASITQQYLEDHNMDTTSPYVNCRGMDGQSCHPVLTFYGSFGDWVNSRSAQVTRNYITAMNGGGWLEAFVTANGTSTPMYPEIEINTGVSADNAALVEFPSTYVVQYRLQFLNSYAKVVTTHDMSYCNSPYSDVVTNTIYPGPGGPLAANPMLFINISTATGALCSSQGPCIAIMGTHPGCQVLTTKAACNLVPLCYWCLPNGDTVAPTPVSFLNLTLPPSTVRPTESLTRIDMSGLTVVLGVLVFGVVIVLAVVACVVMRRLSSGYHLVDSDE
jgi:hypothetical protein